MAQDTREILSRIIKGIFLLWLIINPGGIRNQGQGNLHQRCTISIFHYQFNINYSGFLLINTNFNFNYFKEGLSISIPYQFFKKFLYQFQYQFIVSMSYYDIDKITNFLSISHCSQYQYWYQLMNKGLININ